MKDRDYFLIYTEAEGGEFRSLIGSKDFIKDLFNNSVKHGKFEIDSDYSLKRENKTPAFICMGKVVDNYDFVLGRKR